MDNQSQPADPNPLLGESATPPNPLLGEETPPTDGKTTDSPALTDETIAAKLPDDIIALVISVGTDPSLGTTDPELARVLPSPEVSAAVLAANGHREKSSIQDLDQAQAWLDDQALWQTRATKVEAELQRRFPYLKEQALKGEVPEWMTEPWAVRLIYKWADGLADAVERAEEFIKQKTDGVNNAR